MQFEPFSLAIEPTFWNELCRRKIDNGLDTSPIFLNSFYYLGKKGSSSRLYLDQNSFTSTPPKTFSVNTKLINFNKLTDLQSFDHKQLPEITIDNPFQLFIICFADLKKFKFHYKFAVPALTKLKFRAEECKVEDSVAVVGREFVESRGEKFCVVVDGKAYSLEESVKMGFSPDVICFADPSSLPTNCGWPIRNILQLYQPKTIYCIRQEGTIAFNIEKEEERAQKIVGWTLEGKRVKEFVSDLSSILDPKVAAQNANELNLKLMKWRLMPSLDLQRMEQSKCLILGSGTLGCNVARTLMAWGFRRITMVDNGVVSMSNPVRQNLFTVDSVGKEKAQAAVEMLRKVNLNIEAASIELDIPMPGHSVYSENAIIQMDELVSAHDIVFLLTDSRESRWLPSMLCRLHDKIAITIALGFDSFVAMRHGNKVNNLSCYFCHDIVAPTDSMSNKTIDQTCTVTRPGLSNIASGYGVELAVALLQQSEGKDSMADASNEFGKVPHQIRGYLFDFNLQCMRGEAFDKCTACSIKVLDEYKKNGVEFVKKVLDDSNYLTKVTGLDELDTLTDEMGDFEFCSESE